MVLAAAMDIQAIGSAEQLKPLQYAGNASHVISVSEALELRYRELLYTNTHTQWCMSYFNQSKLGY